MRKCGPYKRQGRLKQMREKEVNCLRNERVSRNLRILVTFLLILVPVCHIFGSMNSNNKFGGSTMTSKYPGTCRNCREQFPAGTQINWSRDNGATHQVCPPPSTPEVKTAPEQLVPGVYETPAGQIYVVKPTREDKTRLYAKKLQELNGDYRTTEAGGRVDFEFVYERGAIYNIRLADRMPLERAKELITLYGRCIACNRHLKAAKSVENGIGPVCIKQFGPVLNPEVETADGRQIVRAA